MVPLVIASAAWACQVMTTLEVNKSQATAGETVTVTGSNYQPPTGTNPNPSPVYIHLDSRDSPPIAQAPAARNISVTFALPADVAIGYHTLIATQFNTNGSPKSGTPGRASIEIVASGARSSGNGGTVTASSANDQESSSSPSPAEPEPAPQAQPAGVAATSTPLAKPAAPAPAKASPAPATATATATAPPPPAAPAPATAVLSEDVVPPVLEGELVTPAPVVRRHPALVPAVADEVAAAGSSTRTTVTLALALALLGLLAAAKSGRVAVAARRVTPTG